ncbi:hypothetical protein KY289_029332 [Solanum tuberosum]|nr:hypothetical protein KY289_029332 [Solanum tuberosum]
MIIRSPEPEVKILVDRDPVKTSFEKWARPGHFSRTIAKGPDTTTWIWNLHVDAHDFDIHTSDLEEISRKVFSAHFSQLSIIFLWLSGIYFHGAHFSNYEAWISDPTHIGPSAQLWRASGITSELQLYCTTIGALVFAALMLFAGLLGLGSLSWAGHQVHVSLPINKFLNAGVDPKEIPLPHEFILNRDLLAQLYPVLPREQPRFHLELGHKGLYEILTMSWNAQLSLNLAMLGSLTIVVAHHMYSMPLYPYLATDYGTQLSLFTHHMWIGGFLIVGVAVHATIFMVRDYDPTTRYNDLLDRVLRHRDAIISHLNWACIFLGFHSFGLYIHNDTMSALGHPQDMFSDTTIQLQPVFAQWIQNTYDLAPGATTLGATASTSLTWGGGDLVAVGGKVALLPIPLGTADFLIKQILVFIFLVMDLEEGSYVWHSVSDQGIVTHITGGNFAQSSITINGWLRDFLWAQASQEDLKSIMTLRFPRFSQGLAQDPTTRRIWFGISIAHDFESHDDITEERLYQNIFASHFGQLAIIFLWTSGNLFHVAWQGNFESWVQDPLHVRHIAHAIWVPHFGQPAMEAFTQGGALGPVNIAYSGVYQWWYTIGLHTNEDLYTGALFLLFLSAISLIAGWLHLQPKWKPSVFWFKNVESRLNHHLSGLFGVSSLTWTGHLVHLAIPASRGEYVRWNNFLDVLPHPQGLGPLFTGQWNLYAQNPDSSSHLFGTAEGARTAILTLLGGFHPQTQSLWLTDMAHHHLAIAFIFLVVGHMYRTNFRIRHNMKDFLDAHIPPGGRLGRGHKGLYDTINNSLHFQLGLALASLGVITSLVAQHMYSLPAYAFIAQDFTTQAALYTHHQYIAGFIMT